MIALSSRIDRRRVFAVAVVVVVFAFAVALRIPRLDAPMSEVRHADGTARVLRHMRAWDEVGFLETHGMMRTTGTQPADRHIPDIGYLADSDGVYYYVSFPPLYPLAPYVVLKVLGLARDATALRVFNLALQGLTCVVLFLLARRLTREWDERASLAAAAVAASAYAIAPMLMWYHSVAYTTASLSTPLFALSVYLAVRLAHDEPPGRGLWIAYGATVALLAYADWLAITYAAAVALLAIARFRDRRTRSLAAVTLAAVGGILVATAVQYGSVAGFAAFVDALSGKYVMRSGLAETSHHSLLSPASWRYVLGYYQKHFVQIAAFAAAFALPLAVDRKARTRVGRVLLSAPARTALGLAFLGTAIHHLALFSHTAVHDFDMNKATVFVAVSAGMIVAGGLQVLRERLHPRHVVTLVAAASVLVALASVNSGFRRNFSHPGHARDFGAAVGAAQVAPDEVVFLEGDEFYLGSSAIYYAGRNVARWRGSDSAVALFERNGATGGALFVMDETGTQVAEVLDVSRDGTVSPSRR